MCDSSVSAQGIANTYHRIEGNKCVGFSQSKLTNVKIVQINMNRLEIIGIWYGNEYMILHYDHRSALK